MDPLNWITLVVGIAAYSLGARTFYHCFFGKPGGHHEPGRDKQGHLSATPQPRLNLKFSLHRKEVSTSQPLPPPTEWADPGVALGNRRFHPLTNPPQNQSPRAETECHVRTTGAHMALG